MIKLINKSDSKISFSTDISISLANAIRRSINYIPVLAIDALEVSKNDSALYDEIISQRMGLVPLTNEKLKLPKECGCEKEDGCTKCSIKFKLSASGPCTVYSTDLSPKENVLYKMPITILNKDQELEFVAIARMGLGIEHTKHSPGMMFYKYSDDLENEEDEKFRKLIEESNRGAKKELIVSIESWGQIKAKEIFPDAVKALNKEISELIKEIK